MKELSVGRITRRTVFSLVGAGASVMLAAPAVGASAGSVTGGFATVDAPGAGTAPGQGSILQGIAANGVLVGIYEDSGYLDHGFTDRSGKFATINDPHADTGSIPPPNTGQGTNSYSTNGRTVVGDYVGPSGVFRGFTFDGGDFSALDDPKAGDASGEGTMPFSVNARGVIVGGYVDDAGVQHGFIFDHNSFADFNDPGAGTASGQGTVLTSVNSLGVLAGYYVDSSGAFHGFTYDAGRVTQYNDPSAASDQTFPMAVNDHGTVVGDYVDNTGLMHGFVFRGGSYSTIDDPSGAEGTAVAAVNDSGVMDGYYVDSHGVYHGFVFSR